MKYLLFIVLLVAVVITAGCVSENNKAGVVSVQTTIIPTIVDLTTSSNLSPSPIITPESTKSSTFQNPGFYSECNNATSNVKWCEGGDLEKFKTYCKYWQMRVNASCSSSSSITPESISDFKTFSNGDFSIQYPSMWTVKEEKNYTQDYTVVFLTNDNNGYHSINVNRDFVKAYPHIKTLSQWISIWTSTAMPDNWYIVEDKHISIDGTDSYQFISTVTEDKYFGICREVHFFKNFPKYEMISKYQMMFCNDPDKYFAKENLYIKMIESFKFI